MTAKLTALLEKKKIQEQTQSPAYFLLSHDTSMPVPPGINNLKENQDAK